MIVAALAFTATSALIADLDGDWTFAITNRSSAAVSISTASSCSAGQSTGDTFSLQPKASIALDCGAAAAEDPRAIRIFKGTTLLCTVHERRNDASYESDDDRCITSTAGGTVPTISIAVVDSP
ncbi:MAG TPA: hypothetical protein VFN49_11345 [Candidatus Aquilonibacter sp.]|nr:hypothetical protein [Candidatus Aquilonibacter sp.]